MSISRERPKHGHPDGGLALLPGPEHRLARGPTAALSARCPSFSSSRNTTSGMISLMRMMAFGVISKVLLRQRCATRLSPARLQSCAASSS